MQKQAQHPQQILVAKAVAGLGTGAVIIIGATPHGQLELDESGYAKHHGTASGGQQVHTIKSKIEKSVGGKATITLQLGNGGKMTIPAADAEVCFAQLLPQLAAINQGAGTTATS